MLFYSAFGVADVFPVKDFHKKDTVEDNCDASRIVEELAFTM